MFKIYNKTMQELIEEVEASRKISPRKNISTTFIVDRKRGKISTSDLTEEDILSLVIEDIKDFYEPNGNYKRENIKEITSSLRLGESLGKNFEPSYNMIITLLELFKEGIPIQVLEVIKAFNGFKKIDEARFILRYEKEKDMDFEPITDGEVISVLKQLEANEINRENKFKLTK